MQLQQVVYGDAPIMGPSDVYSIRTVAFINSWLAFYVSSCICAKNSFSTHFH